MEKRPSFKGITGDAFFSYLASRRVLIGVALAVSSLLFVLLKYAFPYPDLFVDSSNYVTWAVHNFPVAYRPLGYSYFLKLVHFISPAAFFAVLVQYVCFVSSTLFFFLSADYLFGLPTKLRIPILFVTLCNPLLIFETNLLSSDSLFCSLGIAWFTSCIWLVKKPGWLPLVMQLLFLYLCFQVRYTAMFYPVVAVVAFMLSATKISFRIAGVLFTVLLIFLSIEWQTSINEKETGARVFSPFGGWQMANNALYCYKHIDLKTGELPDEQTRIIDQCVKMYIDSVKRPDDIGAAYLWDPRSPLKKYLNICAHRDHSDYMVAWFTASKPLEEYGSYIVRHYPGRFTRHFLWPNTVKFFYPGLEVLANYDYSNIVVTADVRQWFGLETDHLDCKYPFLQGTIMKVHPLLIFFLNIFNTFIIMYFVVKRPKPGTKKLLLLWATFYIGFMLFSIFAADIVMRYISILFIVCVIMPFLFFSDTAYIDEKHDES